MTTREKGTLVGGGGGLVGGTVVGAAVGRPGAGAAIGGLGGAAAGYAIGNHEQNGEDRGDDEYRYREARTFFQDLTRSPERERLAASLRPS